MRSCICKKKKVLVIAILGVRSLIKFPSPVSAAPRTQCSSLWWWAAWVGATRTITYK